MATTRGRLTAASQVVYDQADIFHNDGYTRVLGLTPNQLVLEVYFNNVPQSWILINGASVTDAQVVVGSVYFSPIANGPYSLRWRPSGIGYWRLVLIYAAGNQILAQDYDVSASTAPTQGAGLGSGTQGFKISLVRP